MSRINQSELAIKLNVSRSYISKLVKSGKIAIDENGLLDEESTLILLSKEPKIKRGKGKKGSPVTDETIARNLTKGQVQDEIQIEKLRGLILQNKQLQLEIAQLNRELIPLTEIIETNQKISVSVRAKVLTLPSKVSNQLVGLKAGKIKQILEDEINEILKELNNLQNEC